MSDDEFYEGNYTLSGLSKTSVLKLRYKITDIFDISANYINPSDHLNKIVSFGWFTDDRVEDISDVAIKYNAQLEQPIDLQRIVTVDDFIKAFADKIKDY